MVPGPSYSITLRVEAPVATSTTTDIVSVVGGTGANVTGIDVVESSDHRVVVDVTANAIDDDHVTQIRSRLEENPEVRVRRISDATFLLHLGGKVEMRSKTAIRHRDDLSRIYTPGVARVCEQIARSPQDARRLTVARNTVAVVTDGSAVLGLGNIGPQASMPVMEGKAALFKQFGGVDAWPVPIGTQDTEELIRTIKLISPAYGGINLEDIAAPRCFEVERRLRAELDIPVFHDDQHGTAIVVLAALFNALKIVKKDLAQIKIVVSGVGAAGMAIIRLLLDQGARNIIAFGRDGAVNSSSTYTDPDRQWLGENTNPEGFHGELKQGLDDADVFIGVSAGNIISADDLAVMAKDSIVFALANPTPEVDPVGAANYAKIVATGRSDYPNQINNVLAFPGLFRGLLDINARKLTDEVLVASARAIADSVDEDELNPSFIIPSVFDADVAPAVAQAVKRVGEAAK